MDGSQKSNTYLCSKCGAEVKVIENAPLQHCEFCGAELKKEDLVPGALAYSDEQKEKIDPAAYNRRVCKEKVIKYKRGFFSKFILIFMVLAAAAAGVSFYFHAIPSGILASLQVFLCIMATLLGFGVIKQHHVSLQMPLAILALLLSIPVFLCREPSYNLKCHFFQWDDYILTSELPEPPVLYGYAREDEPDVLELWLYRQSIEDFDIYKKRCLDAGFDNTVWIIEADYPHVPQMQAMRDDEYYLWLIYDYVQERTLIELYDPIRSDPVSLPDRPCTLPEPPSAVGEILSSDDMSYEIWLRGVDEDSFWAYTDKLRDAGFTYNTGVSDTHFCGDNENGISVSVEYRGLDIISIDLEK